MVADGEFTATVDAILRGAIDIHVHAAPDAGSPRRHDIVDLASAARDLGMGGFIFKSHEYPTSPVAYVVNRMVPGIEVFGSVTLNESVGGLNPRAVEVAAGVGARKVWMPTFTADHWSRERYGRPGITVLNETGKLRPAVLDILDIIQHRSLVLGTGHLSVEEQDALVGESCRRGIPTVVTHADMWIPIDWQQELARRGAFIEHAYVVCTYHVGTHTVESLATAIRAVGADQCVLSTDLGQAINPSPPEGFRTFIAQLLHGGLSEGDLGRMARDNPRQLLGLASPPDGGAGRG